MVVHPSPTLVVEYNDGRPPTLVTSESFTMLSKIKDALERNQRSLAISRLSITVALSADDFIKEVEEARPAPLLDNQP